MGRKPDLPCDIEQVIDLLGIEVIRDTGTQLHCRCPFCADRKAHMNVKIRDNVFRCNRCGKGGGILHLYAEFCEVTLHTAYEELCKIFGPDSNEKPREYKRRRKIIETAELPIASAEVRDNTYSNLLSLLTLCPTHQASLKERGLTRDEIDWLGYRTTPTTRLRRIVTELLERGCVLDGVPGFYCQKDTGQWTLDIRGSGIMLPDRNLNGQIEAIQVRLDKVYNQKFYNLTSIDQYYGTQSKCCPHYVGVHEGDEVVCLTEGVMKADIAYSFALGTSYESGFVGLTGVPSYSQFERALEELNSDWTASQEVADVLMREYKLPFRVGHHVASHIVTYARNNNLSPTNFPYEQVKKIYAEVIKSEYPQGNPVCPMSEQEFRDTLNPTAIVANRKTEGGPQPAELTKALSAADAAIAEQREWTKQNRRHIDQSLAKLDADFQKLIEQK